MLPATIPLFPLPNVVLFPGVFLPLHIFEPRYRLMLQEAIRTDRIIGMVLLKPGWESDYAGRPPIYPVGCAGLVSRVDEIDGGRRYNIVLHGYQKFRVRREEPGGAFRRAEVITLPESLDAEAKDRLRDERSKLEALLLPTKTGTDATFTSSLPDEDLVNALSQYLNLQPVERQALLERHDALDRCRALIELVEMQSMATRMPGATGLH